MASEALSLPLLLRPPLVDDFDAGRRGRLTAAYHATLWDWTRLGRSLGAPAYQDHAVQLYAKPNLSSLLEELLAVVQSILPDFDLRTFQKTYESATQSIAFMPRLEQPEVTAATFGGGQSSSDLEFIVVGRSLRRWRWGRQRTVGPSWAICAASLANSFRTFRRCLCLNSNQELRVSSWWLAQVGRFLTSNLLFYLFKIFSGPTTLYTSVDSRGSRFSQIENRDIVAFAFRSSTTTGNCLNILNRFY